MTARRKSAQRPLNALYALLAKRFAANPAVQAVTLTANHVVLAQAAIHGVDLVLDRQLATDIVLIWTAMDPSTRPTNQLPHLHLNHMEFGRDGTLKPFVIDTTAAPDDGPFPLEEGNDHATA